jgi:DNA-binding NarL/FixJ family response regulator
VNTITVLIADAMSIMRLGLATLLADQDDMLLVGETGNGAEAIALAQRLTPHVMLLDTGVRELGGMATLRTVRLVSPHTRVIVFTAQASPRDLARAVVYGATGFLTKHAETAPLLAAIRAAASGQELFDAALLQVALTPVALDGSRADALDVTDLTFAEKRVLILLADGLDNETIAVTLDVSISTIKTHVGHILQKLGVADRTGAAVWAARHGL